MSGITVFRISEREKVDAKKKAEYDENVSKYEVMNLG